jgi:hypothetical protein
LIAIAAGVNEVHEINGSAVANGTPAQQLDGSTHS